MPFKNIRIYYVRFVQLNYNHNDIAKGIKNKRYF